MELPFRTCIGSLVLSVWVPNQIVQRSRNFVSERHVMCSYLESGYHRRVITVRHNALLQGGMLPLCNGLGLRKLNVCNSQMVVAGAKNPLIII